MDLTWRNWQFLLHIPNHKPTYRYPTENTSYTFSNQLSIFFLKIWNYTVQIVKGRDLKSWQYSLIGKSNDSLIRIAWSNPKSFSKAGMQLWIVREAWLTQWACSNVLFAMGWPFVQSGGREAVCSKTQCSSWFQVERERSKPKESHTIHSQLFSHTSFFVNHYW